MPKHKIVMAPKTRRNNKKQNHKEKAPTSSESSDEEETDNSNLSSIITNMQKQFKLQERAMSKIKESQQHISDNFDELKKEIARLAEENKQIKKELAEIKAQSSNVKSKVKSLEKDVLELKQKENKNNVIITNLPKIEKTDLKEIIIKISEQVDIRVDKKDISEIYQTENKKFKTYPLIVKMYNEDFKNKCIDFRKNKQQIDVKKIFPNFDLKGKNVNFHHLLEKELSELLKKVKSEAKNKQYQYVWMKGAKILVRKNDGAAVIQIETQDDIKKLQ